MNNYYFDSLEKLQDKELIFFGTGRVGRLFYQKHCVEQPILSKPKFWIDNNPEKVNGNLFEIPVISVDMLADVKRTIISQRYALIITVGSVNLLQVLAQIQCLKLKNKLMNCDIYFSHHIEAYFYFKNVMDKVEAVSNLFYDKKSNYLYQNLIHNLRKGSPISFDIYEPNQYFGNDVIPELKENEVIVDGGVCEGYEIEEILAFNKNIKIHAFEPDCNSMKILQTKYGKESNVKLYEHALWNKSEELYFDNTIPESASAVKTAYEGMNKINAIALDDFLINEPISLIKMDIEGAEKNALLGAEKTIKKYRPKLAICTYHKFEDYIELPLLIKSMNPEYKLYFRHHWLGFEESVLYAI